ncbi:MAG: hypothetical protein ACJAVV_000620 [Alphaproteobacteria bacterium]|jgi:hypothetical protein
MSENFEGSVSIRPNGGDNVTISLNAETGDILLGGFGRDGDLTFLDSSGKPRISMNGSGNHITIRNSAGNTVASLGSNGNLSLGGTGSDGDITLKDSNNRNRIRIDADAQRLRILATNGETVVDLGRNGNLALGGGGNSDGDLALKDSSGNNRINFDAQNHEMIIRDASNSVIGSLGRNANLRLGSNGHDGDILLYPSSAANHADNAATIHLDGNAGDIILRNADCAEEFTVSSAVTSAPGDVMVLDKDGLLRPCIKAFDTGAVGVISGAGLYKPGIVLDRQNGEKNRSPIALVGKVYVSVTDQNGPIQIGDLLTTSDVSGHAMKASDAIKSFGAVIGKALSNHDHGKGSIPMVIALQ